MTETASTRNKLARRAEQTAVAHPQGERLSIAQLIDRQRTEIARALPRHMDADRLARIATTVVKTTPKLLECTAESLLGALMLSAQTGLEPGPLGHAYFVPRWNKNVRASECQWQIGYKGIIELARRSGQLTSIEAREVCERDEFEYSYGLDERLVHKPYMGGERGPIVAFWGLAKFADGGHYFLVMSKADIDQAKERSDAGRKGFGPWASDYAAMGRKTVIRRMAPFLPLSAEQATVLTHDETVNTRVAADLIAEPAEASWVDAEAWEDDDTPTAALIDEETAEPAEARDGQGDGPESVTGPDPEPDAGQAQDAENGELVPMSDGQRKALHSLLRQQGATGDARFPVLTKLLDREVTSTKEISAQEASWLIDHLQGAAVDGEYAETGGDQ